MTQIIEATDDGQRVNAVVLARREPEPTDKAYVDYTEARSKGPKQFNHLNQITRSVQISGKTLVFDAADSQGILVRISDSRDIEKIELFADEIIIRARLGLPSANVHLYANELRFEGDGAIDTTPSSLEASSALGKPGAHGPKGGDIHVYVKSFFSEKNRKNRFISNGGAGQSGGPGANGTQGAAGHTMGAHQPEVIAYAKRYGLSGPTSSAKTPTPPGLTLAELEKETLALGEKAKAPENGRDATPGGRPGNGGNAGTLHCILRDLGTFAQMEPGKAPPPRPKYKGGKGGAPNPGLSVAYVRMRQDYQPPLYPSAGGPGVTHRVLEVGSVTRGVVKNGADAVSPAASKPTGAKGKSVVSPKRLAWCHPHAMAQNLAFAEDAYESGFYALARAELERHDAVLTELMASSEWKGLPQNDRSLFEQQAMRIRLLLGQLRANQDYWGNPGSWVPALSLEANLAIFEQEVRWAIRSIFLIEWLRVENRRARDATNALADARQALLTEIGKLDAQFNEALEQIPLLKTEATNALVLQGDLDAELLLMEQRIITKAQQNVEARNQLPFWKKALRVVAVVARSLPVGQPALGVVGHGLDFVLNFDADEPLSSFAALPDALAAFSKSNVDKDAKKAKEEKDEQRPEEKKDKSSDLQKIVAGYNEYLAPVVKALKAQKDLFADTTMKKEELQAELAKELEKLKEADEGYQALTQKIGALLAGREQLAARIEAASNALLEAATGISEHWSQIAELTTGVSTSGALVLSHRAEMALDALRRKASRRLQKYPYALSRAYEYRMLRPYAGDLTLHRLFEQMRVLIVGSGNGLLDSKASDMLYGLYREEVAAIVEEVADDYNAGAAVHTASVRYELSSEELARLNAGERVELDFWERGAFKSSDEDVRIVGLAFVPSELQVEQTGSSSFSYLDLVTEHGGMSRIWRDGKVRAFQHHSSRSPQPLRWTTRWEAGNVTQHQPAASSESLLRALLPDAAVDIMLFSNRSAWAVLSLRKEAHAGPSVDFMIRRACLELRYDYRPSTGQQWSLYRDQQHMAIQRLYEQLLQRSANERELREARAMLDIGYDDAELRSFVLQTHHEERLGVEVDALYAALARPAPTAHERAFWMNELSSGRPSQQVSAYVQAIAAQFGQPASFDELAQWVELLDSGAAPAKRQALRGAAE